MSFYDKTEALHIAQINVRRTILTSSISQPSLKQHIFTNMPIECLFMVRFSKMSSTQSRQTPQYF